MDVTLIEEPDEVLELAGEFLRQDPFTTNVIATQIASMVMLPTPVPGAFWAVASDRGTVRGVAMQTPPNYLFLSRMDGEAAAAIAGLLAGRRELPGASGEISAVARFSDEWARLTGSPSRVHTAMRMYALDELVAPADVPGAARTAGEGDFGLVTSWLEAFQAEAQPGTAGSGAGALAERWIRQGGLWLWCDLETTSMAGVRPAAAGVARVGPVYTPPEHRRRGYGAAVTAAATEAAVRDGAGHVVLYTDLANPTSNSIYQALGFVAHHDAEERDFLPEPVAQA